MVIFGGFYKVANELNDLHVFDLERQRWRMLAEEAFPGHIAPHRDLNRNQGGASQQSLPVYESQASSRK